MKPGSFVVAHLINPQDKLWGRLHCLAPEGITLRGISLASFDDWARELRTEEKTMGLATVFVPLFRIEKIYQDERMGSIPSYMERFNALSGQTIEAYFGQSTEPTEAN